MTNRTSRYKNKEILLAGSIDKNYLEICTIAETKKKQYEKGGKEEKERERERSIIIINGKQKENKNQFPSFAIIPTWLSPLP